MKNLITDFSEKALSLITGLVFLTIGVYELFVTGDLINGTKFIISAGLFGLTFYKLNERLHGRKRKEYRAGYGLIIIGSFVSVFGNIVTHIFWVLGIILLVRAILNEKVNYGS